jgi:hypothetical protein
MFESAAVKAGDDLTPTGILQGLAELDGDDLGGATMPLEFTLGQNAPKQMCFFAAAIRNRQLETIDGGKRHCE